MLEVPGFVVGELIGAGGFGEVYAARHVRLDREVAIKVLHPRLCSDEEAVQRFEREARAASRISHPGIVEILDFGVLADGRAYCVMERISGQTLRQVLDERGRLALDEAMPVLASIASAIDAAHEVGIVHRDLKPDNVFVLAGGQVKLIDFGLAKLTREEDVPLTEAGAVFGTPLYMSPEQCRGKLVDARSDLYAFGALAYHVICGAPPFAGTALEIALHHLNDPAPSLREKVDRLDERVDAGVLQLLDKDPARRPASASAAIALMRGVARGRRRLPWRAIAIGVGVLAAIATGAIYLAGRAPGPTYRLSPLALPKLDNSVEIQGARGNVLVFRDGSRFFETDVTTGDQTPLLPEITNASSIIPTGGGELVVSREDDTISVVDARGARRAGPFAGRLGRPSPDGRWVAAVRGTELVAYELATGAARRLSELGTATPTVLDWRGDSNSLIWRDIRNITSLLSIPVRETSLDGKTVGIDLFVEGRDTVVFGAADLLACVGMDDGAELRSIDRRRPSAYEVVHKFPATESQCSIVATTASTRFVVITSSNLRYAATIEVRDGDLHALPSRARTVPWAWSADGGVIYAMEGPSREPTGPIAIDARTEVRRPLRHCPGETKLSAASDRLTTRRGDGTTAVALWSGDDCHLVAEWTLPWSTGFFNFQCGRARCAVAHSEPGFEEVWLLDLRQAPRLLVRMPMRGQLTPEMAISADGTRISVSRDAWVTWIDAATGAATDLAVPGTMIATSWIDPSTMLVWGHAVDGKPRDAIRRLGIDGALSPPLWSSHDLGIGNAAMSPDGSRIAVSTSDQRRHYYIFEQGGD